MAQTNDPATQVNTSVIVRMRPSNVYIGATLQSVVYVAVSTPYGSSTVQLSANGGKYTLVLDDHEYYLPESYDETITFAHGHIQNNFNSGRYVITTINGIQVPAGFSPAYNNLHIIGFCHCKYLPKPLW